MIANIINVLVWGSIVAALVSCNVYAPFDSKSSDADRIEAAQKCLHDGDYDCAIEQYNEISDSTEKSKRLCMVYLSKSGVGINTLVTTVQSGGVKMLGTVAQSLMPWDSGKSTSADSAVTHCSAYRTAAGATQTAFLLKTMGHLVRCATLMAKTDLVVGNTGATPCTTTTGNANGTLTTTDILNGGTGMCDADALTCQSDIDAVNTAAGSLGSDLSAIKTAATAVYGAGFSTATAPAARTAIQATIP